MAGNRNLDCFKQLLKNEKAVLLDTATLLLRIANNVLNDAENPKYRLINIGSSLVMDKLLPVCGGMECLFEMGYEEDEDKDGFVLPTHASLENLTIIRNTLNDIIQSYKPPAPVPSASVSRTSAPRMETQLMFLKRLHDSFEQVLNYEIPILQQKALKVIPHETLLNTAKTKAGEGATQAVIRDFLLLELLRWFKVEFFQWMDSPKCELCAGKTVAAGMTRATNAELADGGGRVEKYHCSVCRRLTRFVRYNNPGKLLETRCGRCGEWANCFTLCCRALDFDARYVLDWTDHVWTEVYSEAQHRWLHCDPCENVCDKPLLYEVGWKKKLVYVIAFSKDEIQDVTWRYTCQPEAVLSRRNECRENDLVQVMLSMSKQRQIGYSATEKSTLLQRRIAEVVELMTSKDPASQGELGGRESGSLAWRMARGETGEGGKQDAVSIKPTEEELAMGYIQLKYCCASDTYVRANNSSFRGWPFLIHEAENMIRKEEYDWDMVYLARQNGAKEGKISWKFDCSGLSAEMRVVEVQVKSTCFENGKIRWLLCSETSCIPLTPDGKCLKTKELKGAKWCTLSAVLSGGVGDVAWQHTQLFRQALADKQNFPLNIKITLKKL